MEKETVTMFNLEAAFKALDEIDMPKMQNVERFKANRVNLKEYFNAKSAHEVLIEDYFDINDTDDLNAAKEEREAEVAKAKLARIEKIVDLDAETEEDILPSYVGKVIMQCPQCMTLFYKNEEDIEKSEETPDVVNINEVCQHCGNVSGYTLVGKVGGIEAEEAENFDLDEVDSEENELDLEFPEEGTEEVDAEGTGDGAEVMEDEEDLDLDLDFEEEIEEETEEANESLHNSALLDKIEDKNDLKTDIESEHLTLNEDFDANKEYHIFIDLSGSWHSVKNKLDALVAKDFSDHQGELHVDYFDDYNFAEPLAAAKDGKNVVIYTDGDCEHNCPELCTMPNVTIKYSKEGLSQDLEEDLADWYRKKFDRPASTATQQAWEDELNGEMGEISDKRRNHLERKFAQQRDWEKRHTPEMEAPIKKTEVEEPAMAESMHNSELLNKIEDKNDLKTDINSEHHTLNEESGSELETDAQKIDLTYSDKDIDKLYDELWSGSQPTDTETEANLQAIEETKAEAEDFDELDDTFDEHITEYLKEVYSNIESYTSVNCTMRGTKLVVEGLIKFQSGREKNTKFTFDASKRINNSLVFRGMNEGLTSEKSAFRLACKTQDKTLVTESLSYKYSIDGNAVKGKTVKN
jgi:hypothetical protein